VNTQACIPVILNDNVDKPYSYLTFNGVVKLPTLTFEPASMVLGPVPLDTLTCLDFSFTATDYFQYDCLYAKQRVIQGGGGWG